MSFLPNTRSKEIAHRKHKRQIEIKLVAQGISNFIRSDPDFAEKKIRILEFGSGNGFQIPYLKRFGKVTASDICINENIKKVHNIEYINCSITHTPFYDEQFDIIFSNHVLEHINNLPQAFSEIKRIGKSWCIYAFTVPTNIWLLHAIPSQYLGKMKYVINRISSKLINGNNLKKTQTSYKANLKRKTNSKIYKVLRLMLPGVHGASSNFIECYRKFRIKNWERLFSDNGFFLLKKKPLLYYGPSEWPIVNTARCKSKLCSSVLFLMKEIKN